MKHSISILSVACAFLATQAAAQVSPSSATQITQPTAPTPQEQNQFDTSRQVLLKRKGGEPNTQLVLNQRCSLFSSRMNWWSLSVDITYLSTLPSFDCQQEELQKLTAASATAQLRSVPAFGRVVKGVSSHYLMDAEVSSVTDTFYTLGSLPFSPMAYVTLPTKEILKIVFAGNNLHLPRYMPFLAVSNVDYVWNLGSIVHELVMPDGRRFIMYAFTSAIDQSLTRQTLASLRNRLKLPNGWQFNSYSSNKLITVRAAPATGFQVMFMFDELNNYYIEYTP